MSNDYWDYVARKPRHEAGDPGRALVEIERISNNCQDTLEAVLVDLSRQGIQVRVGEDLPPGEGIRVRLADPESGFDYQLTAITRWCQPITENEWAVGCQFESEADWEVIGELLLTGVLSMEA